MKYQIKIWNFNLDLKFYTPLKEGNGEEQLEHLHKLIKELKKDSDNLILETTAGTIIFTQVFLSTCLFKLKRTENENI